MTISELTAAISENVELVICINPGREERFILDDPIQVAAYGDFIVDKLMVLGLDKLGISIKMRPLKKEG